MTGDDDVTSRTTKKQIALATYDLRFSGGVKSVAEFTAEALDDRRYDSYFVYNAYPWEECATATDLIKGNWSIKNTQDSHDGTKVLRIGRRLPELLVTNYRLNRSAWQSALIGADTGLVLGGPCLAGVPLAHSETPYVVWMGTTIQDERDVQKQQFGLGRRIRYELARPVLKRQERTVLRNADKVLVQSSYTKRRVVEKHGLNGDAVDVVPVPVDTENFSPGEPETDQKEIVFVGRLNDPRKNTELLLEAFAQVVKDVPDAKLTLVGGDPAAQYKRLMEELGIRENVSTPGKVDSVVPYLRRAAVFAFPSHQEGFGIAALEALACGTPVVSTRSGGPEDFVVDDETGYLVDQGDVEGFANAVRGILDSPVDQERMGVAGREIVVDNYTRKDIEKELNNSVDKITSVEYTFER
ncbi:glycosyltransferase family 4 protein [Halorubrum sp. GN11GM_10-3_MGM]|uniref:glycosyltransferase family 4 protein n=1 Tax=Halorubrum sp. GN11GM_10-3_MGM TaxID=2518111 RepID=UPI0010F49EB2|nr:glycosyltransferase family 4 protein [Halorubrum sp. GN11GM_10-3_MGM]TKX71838.1 glycosyltransferase family 1 protein [Halorubrum sp. GN11GM_10-3_MGM]